MGKDEEEKVEGGTRTVVRMHNEAVQPVHDRLCAVEKVGESEREEETA